MNIRDNRKLAWRRLFSKPSFYRKMVLIALLSSIIPIIIFGIFSYMITTKTVKDEAIRNVSQILNYASHTIDEGLDRTQNNLMQMQLGSFFTSDMAALKRNNYSGFYADLYKNLLAFKNGNPQIKDIAYYTLDENYLISTTYGGRKIETVFGQQKVQKLLEEKKSLSWLVGYSLNDLEYKNGLSLISAVPLHKNDPIGFIRIVMDNQMFESLVKPFVKYEHERMYVLDESGELVFNVNGDEAPENLHELITVTNSEKQEFLYHWEGKEYLVTSKLSPVNNLLFVDMIPTKELYSSSKWIASMTLILVLVVIVTGITLSMIGTQRMYRPIKKLVKQISGSQTDVGDTDELGYVNRRWKEINSKAIQLEGQLNEQLPIIREIFALRLMEGQFTHHHREHVLELMRRYDIPEEQSAVVFIITYDQIVEEAKFQEDDKDLIVFIMKNIAAELLEQRQLDGIVINSLNDQVVVWLWSESEEAVVWEQSLKSTIEEIRQQIAHYLRSPVTIGLSRITEYVEQLPDIYREAQLAIHSRMIDGGNQIVESRGLTNLINYRYPSEVESHLVESLQVGDLAETHRMLSAFSNKLHSAVHNPELILMSYDQLLSASLRTAYLMGIHIDSLLGRSTSELYSDMRKCVTIQELTDWFEECLIEPIIMSVSTKKNQEAEHLIQRVTDYIAENYHLDLSLDQCAQICNLSPQYLSKLFKKAKDISFIEYVTHVRVEKARELLESTDLFVNEVAEQVGYNPKNFIRVFKKQVGLPPGQYRDMHRK